MKLNRTQNYERKKYKWKKITLKPTETQIKQTYTKIQQTHQKYNIQHQQIQKITINKHII